ncbi:MAG: ABC transporter substrate-binding protein [Candidatus Entotheonellia bacterium]
MYTWPFLSPKGVMRLAALLICAIALSTTVAPTPAAAAAAATSAAFPQAGVGGVPASVAQLTIGMDGWGGDVIDPWQYIGTGLLQSYLNLRLLHRDEQMQIVPLWAIEWKQTNEGIHLTLNPKAKWQDGTPATADDLKANFEALMGKYAPDFKGTPRTPMFKRVVQEVEILGPHQVFVRTETPDPNFFPLVGGANYHLVWFGPSTYLRQVGHEGYIKHPIGGGPYKIKEFKASDRIVWERWEDFWGDYPYWQKPQHRIMEWLQIPDDAARFALLKGKQVDMAVNIPYAIAKDLPRSESGQRGVNPTKGPLWTQTLRANGKMQITFDAEFIIKEKSPGWEGLQNDPTLHPKVREALELAIDKRAIVENFHYGFTSLNQSIYSQGSFGWRKEQGEKLSPHDPKRAKELLAEAGYPNGFSTTIHFGVFPGRPGQPEALEAIASYWKDIGVDLKIVQHDPTEFYTRLNKPDRAYRPMTLVTWGRQENGEYIADQAASESGGRAVYNDRTNALAKELASTLDEAKRLRLMAEIEDEVLRNRWVIPLYDASAVFAYADRVLAHPMPAFGAHFLDLNRIVLKK